LLNRWSDEESFLELAAGVASRSDYRANVTGIDGSARIFFLAALAKQSGRPALIIAQDMARAEKIYSDLASFLPAEQVNLLPARELFVNGGILTQSGDCREKRLQFLEWLHSKGEGIYVAPGEAFLSKALPPVLWQNLRIDLLASQLIDRQELLQQLVERGYERVSLTENKGQFSARGEVIDVYPPGVNMPFRLELFGDTIQSLRWYDPQTQRSGGHLENASVIPARELVLPGSVYHRGEQLIQSNLEQTLVKLRRRGEVDVLARLKQRVGQQIERLSEPDGLDLFNSYFSFFYEDGASLLDYLPPDFLVFLEEPTSVIEKETVLRREFEDYRSNSLLQGDMLFDCSEPLWKVEELLSRLPCPLISCSYFSGSITGVNLGQIYRLEAKSASYYHGKWELFRSDFKDWLKRGYRVYLLTGSEQRGRELLKVLAEPSLSDVDISENYTIDSTLSLQLIVGSLGEGFIIPGLRMAVITEHNLLPHRPKKRQLSRKEGIRLKDYRDLAVGDYVVHEHHGIGKYLGLSTLEIGGLVRDYLLLKYRGTDKLYIPVEQVEMIQKYAGGEGQTPRLHSLGGGEWQRLKGKVSSSVQQIARELLSLYAARQVVEGYGFGDDHPWQQEFEAHFPYEETPDQLKAVADVKADLGKKQPMDRLICGDVGYGKTEVALRAAFKVVMEGKQTAVLVPTTILAQQHYGTFKERFAHFPVRVAQLSRFVSPAQQKEIIRELSQGQIDIVIGTHSLLSKKV
ncbi:MAG TPA: CarD family transcriptional regulator, partial [Candidatus Limnocylindrales bacterium]|nr:CarD family transcriptional regulator [Candidatus Limnocylindrales bacterium]